MADTEISRLPPLAGALLQPVDALPLADLSASETKKITAKELVQFGVQLIDDGSIPGQKVNLVIPPGSVGTTELADRAVTALKLSDNSSAFVGPAAPANPFIGQLWVDSGTNYVYAWSGSQWAEVKAAGSVNAVFGDTTNFNVSQTAQILLADLTLPNGAVVPAGTLYLAAEIPATTAAGQFIAGPAAAGGAVAPRRIASTDLPVASATAIGGVSVSGDGLRVTPGGAIQIDNDITGSVTYGVVTYNAKGLVTAGRPITSNDLPAATAGAKGAVFPGTGLAVSTSGQLNHSNSIVAGSAAKVAYDQNGHITQALPLTDVDIPNLPASKITSGTFAPALYGDRSIPQDALANYSISYIQEAEPGVTAGDAHIGMLWFQESTGALRMFNGNSWFPVGFGRLAQDNLRWGGLFDANTGTVTGVTELGLQFGLAVGGPIPPPTDILGGLYLVAQYGGNGVSVTPGVVYDEGDWCLCINQASGWVRIDTMSGGGGGGGASFLDDLLDVTLSSPIQNQVLIFDATQAQWTNRSISAYVPVQSVFGRVGHILAEEGDYNLDLLGDVTLSSAITGDLLQFDGTQWVNVPSSSVGGVTSVFGRSGAVVAEEGDYSLDLLSDVSLLNVAAGELLQHNGIQWINVPVASVAPVLSVHGRVGDVVAAEGDYTLDLLGDVTLSTAVTDDVLRFDGAGWVNTPSTALATADTLVKRDATGSVAVNVMTATVFDLDALPALP